MNHSNAEDYQGLFLAAPPPAGAHVGGPGRGGRPPPPDARRGASVRGLGRSAWLPPRLLSLLGRRAAVAAHPLRHRILGGRRVADRAFQHAVMISPKSRVPVDAARLPFPFICPTTGGEGVRSVPLSILCAGNRPNRPNRPNGVQNGLRRLLLKLGVGRFPKWGRRIGPLDRPTSGATCASSRGRRARAVGNDADVEGP